MLSVYKHLDDSERAGTGALTGKSNSKSLQAITPLIFSHVNPYGLFKLEYKGEDREIIATISGLEIGVSSYLLGASMRILPFFLKPLLNG